MKEGLVGVKGRIIISIIESIWEMGEVEVSALALNPIP